MVDTFGAIGARRRHLRHARARRDRLRGRGRRRDRPDRAVAAGAAGALRELALRRRPRQRLRVLARADVGAGGRAPARPSRSARSQGYHEASRVPAGDRRRPRSRGCSTSTPASRSVSRRSRSGSATCAPTPRPPWSSPSWCGGWSRPRPRDWARSRPVDALAVRGAAGGALAGVALRARRHVGAPARAPSASRERRARGAGRPRSGPPWRSRATWTAPARADPSRCGDSGATRQRAAYERIGLGRAASWPTWSAARKHPGTPRICI